ncbi:MAG: lysozyme [Rhizobiales bacterium]|nr:lysozyme [Hyphomicrobiales bacterium]OJY06694.1 MAG: glycoside hydrolase [Rhizobiales bacterium 63-22]
MASKRAKTALASGLGLVALTATYLTAPWEGKSNKAYYDALGRVWTVGIGETKGVTRNSYCSDDECSAMLMKRLEKDFHQPLQRCVPGFDKAPISVQASMLDLAYNVGVSTVCRSTAARRVTARNWAGACQAMTWFNQAGGRVIAGLKKRRENGDATRIGEKELCLAGLN